MPRKGDNAAEARAEGLRQNRSSTWTPPNSGTRCARRRPRPLSIDLRCGRFRIMCELFAMSSRSRTRVSFSLGRLADHGTPGGSLADGWGVACYDGRDVRVMREPEPAGGSPWLEHALEAGRPHSRLVIAHIRHATRGGVCLANTQPFVRELGGRMHVFAHNGMLSEIDQAFDAPEQRFRPVGETDSEVAFCLLLDRLGLLWRHE